MGSRNLTWYTNLRFYIIYYKLLSPKYRRAKTANSVMSQVEKMAAKNYLRQNSHAKTETPIYYRGNLER